MEINRTKSPGQSWCESTLKGGNHSDQTGNVCCLTESPRGCVLKSDGYELMFFFYTSGFVPMGASRKTKLERQIHLDHLPKSILLCFDNVPFG